MGKDSGHEVYAVSIVGFEEEQTREYIRNQQRPDRNQQKQEDNEKGEF